MNGGLIFDGVSPNHQRHRRCVRPNCGPCTAFRVESVPFPLHSFPSCWPVSRSQNRSNVPHRGYCLGSQSNSSTQTIWSNRRQSHSFSTSIANLFIENKMSIVGIRAAVVIVFWNIILKNTIGHNICPCCKRIKGKISNHLQRKITS